jgi:hypothetical protein
MAAHVQATPALPAQKRRNFSLWLGLIGSMAVWAAHYQFLYAIAPWSCSHGTALLHVTSLITLALIVGGIGLSWRNWNSVGGETDSKYSGEVGRVKMLSALGMMVGTFLAVSTIAQWIAVAMLDPCKM